ncbi:MAG: DUF4126 domain-containing protein [Prolixibacteraceae bacterium]|jgi:hypothetical protein|nr:DUF4126 domain-containing protein [Prolixibacteraceae bacterium]MDI9564633.1 DUF4126 domain-containing protein [Bacteroidota bacterium]OQB81899.1 MAG: hypothetical protein BWX87_00199 [Bacteroidetes bacterium ADurb.Bin123]HNU77096.1 DUF4126 domain-containing protein [Prolixibacteraceae bacterium]HNZ69679.1 DUF4126 domain-containing protein [Prolixibacteraceae bacterium]
MEKEIITAIALGIGLSASTGFRVFLPLLVAGIAARLGFLPLTESFSWLSGNTSLISLGVATIVEIGAYYIPFIDNLLDSISTPLAVGAGTLITASVLPADSELVKWITSFIVGGGAAAAVQGGTAALRLGSTGTTGGTGNFLVSTGENIAATVTPIVTIIIPVIMALLILGSFFIIFRLLFRRKKNKSAAN